VVFEKEFEMKMEQIWKREDWCVRNNYWKMFLCICLTLLMSCT